MSLTKEECLKARDIIFSYINADEMSVDEFNDSVVIFNELIKEHFDNPPLKLEELHEGMWVWDNDYKLYCLIDRIYSFNKFSVNYHFNTMQEFEENRFYRWEVKVDESCMLKY